MERNIHDGKLYITAVARGTTYTLMRHGDGWGVASRRLALGQFNPGSFKAYATLAEVAAGCKAFGSVEALTASVYGLTEQATI